MRQLSVMALVKPGLVIFSTLAASGCAMRPPEIAPPLERDVYLRAPVPVVWDALLEVLTERNIAVETMDRSSWFLRTAGMELGASAGENLDCGRSGLGEAMTDLTANHFGASYTVRLRAAADSTAVRVHVAPLDVFYRGAGIVFEIDSACVSRGTLEARFLEGLRRRLLPRAP